MVFSFEKRITIVIYVNSWRRGAILYYEIEYIKIGHRFKLRQELCVVLMFTALYL